MSPEAPPSPDISAYYERYWSEEGYDPVNTFPVPLREILEMHVRYTDDCIDVGCGKGTGIGRWLTLNARSYLGVDISETAVKAVSDSGLNARQISDASSIPCPDDSMDLAVCLEVFEHLLNPHLAAKEILRILRPGGRLIATVPNIAHWRRRADLALIGRWNPLGDDQAVRRPWRDPHIRFFGRPNLRDMLTEAGFESVEAGGFSGPFLTDLPRLHRFVRGERPGPIYGWLIRKFPGLFGRSLYAIAVKSTRPGLPPAENP